MLFDAEETDKFTIKLVNGSPLYEVTNIWSISNNVDGTIVKCDKSENEVTLEPYTCKTGIIPTSRVETTVIYFNNKCGCYTSHKILLTLSAHFLSNCKSIKVTISFDEQAMLQI